LGYVELIIYLFQGLIYYFSFLLAVAETHRQEREPAQKKELQGGPGVKMYEIQAVFSLFRNWDASQVEAVRTPIFVAFQACVKTKTWFTWIHYSTTITAPIQAILTMATELHLLRAILATYVLVIDCAAFVLIILFAENLGVRFFQKEKFICRMHEI